MSRLLLKYVALKGVCDICIGFSVGVDSICGSQNDYWQLMSPNSSSFSLLLFTEKADD
jgi:hypothetical protein